MATVEQVLDAMEHVRACTGDAMAGLAPDDLVTISMSMPGAADPQSLDAILTKIHRRYPSLFDPGTGAPVTPAAPGPSPQQGDTPDAVHRHEDELARQTDAAAHLDLLVITAVTNAHSKARNGRDTLARLQHEIEDAVLRRTDLDTPAGARDFQRFLTGKLGEIEAVLQDANLDATSYRALMTAWKSLYAAGTPPADTAAPPPVPPPSAPAPKAAPPVPPDPVDDPFDPMDPYPPFDELPPPPIAPPPLAAAPAAAPPAAAPFDLGSGGLPAPPTVPAGLSGVPALADLLGAGRDPVLGHPDDLGAEDLRGFDDPLLDDPDPDDEAPPDEAPPDADCTESTDGDTDSPEPPPGPATVTLPDGSTVTAPSAELAAVITAATAGTPIPDAFTAQGITIPAPGTAVSAPLDPTRLAPGDIGLFTDRHALAVGNGKALLDGQIQQLSSVAGPSFLGWEHPPEPGPAATEPHAEAPAPTRPADG
ncbi:hypothetical protein BHQ15_06105 [Mycolicibacillus koreensis]|nr:hypothetical protein BHQ15_06105 [Mycolicibacillus koreensis]